MSTLKYLVTHCVHTRQLQFIIIYTCKACVDNNEDTNILQPPSSLHQVRILLQKKNYSKRQIVGGTLLQNNRDHAPRVVHYLCL